MAWKWSGESKAPDGGDWIGFLDKGVKLEGKLELAGTFRIDSQVKGTIVSQQSLILGENAKVEGQIEGNHIVVGGRFDGVIMAKGRVEIQAKGIVTGEIHSPCLVIEAGGIFDGRCHMLSTNEAAKPLTIPIRAVTNEA
jgi:cytoskeletal protein CcmA (bactofilin family)